MIRSHWHWPFGLLDRFREPRNISHSERAHELLKFFIILSLFAIFMVILMNLLFAFSSKALALDQSRANFSLFPGVVLFSSFEKVGNDGKKKVFG